MGYIKETLIMKFDCNYMYTHVQIYIYVCLRLMKMMSFLKLVINIAQL